MLSCTCEIIDKFTSLSSINTPRLPQIDVPLLIIIELAPSPPLTTSEHSGSQCPTAGLVNAVCMYEHEVGELLG